MPVTHLRKVMLEELQRRNLSAITTRIYLHSIEEFAQYFKTPPDRLGLEHVRQYQAHLFTDRKLEAVSVAQQLSALRFFFLKTLKRPWLVEDMPVPKRPIRLPEILSQEEVERLIQCAGSPLHRIWLLTLYATGIRREELVQLQIGDIDSDRMLIRIRQGKGKRIVTSCSAQGCYRNFATTGARRIPNRQRTCFPAKALIPTAISP